MHYTLACLAVLTASVFLASAAQLDRRAPPDFVACRAVQNIVRSLQADQSAATPFCRTFISIPAVTSTETATTIVTPTPVVIIAETITPAPVVTTVTETVEVGETVYSRYTPTASAAVEKRAPDFARQFPKSALSVACSCLSVAPETATVTSFVTESLPAATVSNTVTAAAPVSTVTTTTTVAAAGPTVTFPALCAPSVVAMLADNGQTSGGNGQTEVPEATTADSSATRNPPPPAPFNAAQAELCPMGVGSRDELSNFGEDPFGFRIGPCVINAVEFL
ncbi:MAG: hypothetical protein Q9169_005188 [Polycauliona sp. 2 TL-2023]